MIKSGGAVSGTVYYPYRFPSQKNDLRPIIKNDTVETRLVVKSIFGGKFGNTAKTKILFSKMSFGDIAKLVSGIEEVSDQIFYFTAEREPQN